MHLPATFYGLARELEQPELHGKNGKKQKLGED
jgi:hypothetical protein